MRSGREKRRPDAKDMINMYDKSLRALGSLKSVRLYRSTTASMRSCSSSLNAPSPPIGLSSV